MGLSSRICRYIAFVDILFIVQIVVSQESGTSVCRHDYCEKSSTDILINGNFTVHPCDDFYEHACGLFIRKRNIPENSLSFSYPQIITNTVRAKLKSLLETPKLSDESLLAHDAKDLYKACMDTDRIDTRGIRTFEFYMKMAGGWPMSMHNAEWRAIRKSWDVTHNYLTRLTGMGSLVHMKVLSHKVTNNVPMIHLDHPQNLYGKYSPILNYPLKDYYKEFFRDIALIFAKARGSTVSVKDIDNDIDDMFKFRERLVKIMKLGDEARRERYKYNIHTLQYLQEWYDHDFGVPEENRMNWPQFVTDLFVIDIKPLNGTEKVVLMDRVYLSNIMNALARTEIRTIVNHIQCHFLENHINYLPSYIRDKARLLHKRLTGDDGLSESDRWKFCITKHPMQHVLSKMYVDTMLSTTMRRNVRYIATSIRSMLNTKISSCSWIDEPTKEKALSKLNSMKIICGFPDWYNNVTALEQYYIMQAVGLDALSNALSYSQVEYRMETAIVRETPPRITSHDYATDRTVIYNPEQNTIHINAAMIQWPYYEDSLPQSVNFGALGLLIGNQIVRAIDIAGIHFDENGLVNDWWGESLEEYKKRLKCIVSKYTGNDDSKLPPFINSIADVLSIRLVTDTYLEYSKLLPSVSTPKLPGLAKYSNMETFYLVYGSLACVKIDPTYNETLAEKDLYNLPVFRVNVPLTLSWEFSRAYGCYDFSIMNPQHKCEVWDA